MRQLLTMASGYEKVTLINRNRQGSCFELPLTTCFNPIQYHIRRYRIVVMQLTVFIFYLHYMLLQECLNIAFNLKKARRPKPTRMSDTRTEEGIDNDIEIGNIRIISIGNLISVRKFCIGENKLKVGSGKIY